MSDQDLLERGRALTLGEAERAVRFKERIEAAGRRSDKSLNNGVLAFTWQLCQIGLHYESLGQSRYASKVALWDAIRDDEQDPLEAAEQAAMEELKDG